MTEDGGQMTEDGGQKIDIWVSGVRGRGLRMEVIIRNAEVGKLKLEQPDCPRL